MRFPVGIVVDFLREKGCSPALTPGALGKSFGWALLAPSATGLQAEEDILFITNDPETAPPGSSIIVLGDAIATRNNALMRIADPGAMTAEALVSSLQLYLLSIYQWIEDMHHALANHCSCAELLELSEPVLKNYISVTDSTFSYIAHTPGIAPIEDASRYLLEHGRYSDEVIEAVGKSGLSELWSKPRPVMIFESNAINPKPVIEHVYHLNSQYAAHLVMVCDEPITSGQEFLFRQLIPAVGTVLGDLWRGEGSLAHRFTPFISGLAQDGVGDRPVACKQANTLGIPVSGVFKAIVVAESWKGGSSSYFVERALQLLDGCWAVADGDDLLILLHAAENDPGQLSTLEDRAFALVRDLDTQAGVSRKFFDLFELPLATAEARVALRYGRQRFREFEPTGAKLDNVYSSHVYRFKRFFPFYACDPDARSGTLLDTTALADTIIGAMEREDVENGTDDVRVLRTYLRFSCALKETATALGMHRNSVAYRLKHISQRHDLDLADPDEIAFLQTLFLLPR